MPSNQNSLELKSRLIQLIQEAKYRKIEKLFESNRDKQFKDVQIWQLFAQGAVQTGNYRNIIHCCRKILRIEPDNAQVMFNLAAALQNQGDRQEAIGTYQRCISNLDLPVEYRALAHANIARLSILDADDESAEQQFEMSLGLVEDTAVRTDLAEYYLHRERYEQAMENLKIALSKQPDSSKACFLLAQLHHETRNFIASEQIYRQFVNDHPDHVNAINNLGRVYEELGKLDDALGCYRRCVELSPGTAVSQRNLGRALMSSMQYDRAESAFAEARRIQPDDPETCLLQGRLYIEMGREDEARSVLEHALGLDIDSRVNDPYGFVSDVRYYLSNLNHPDEFDDDKKIYVAGLFDKYADTFEDHLVTRLEYGIPEIVDDLVTRHVSRDDNITMDLGCGTGLCCRYLKPVSSHVTGLDISSKMIAKARERACYDELIVGEICEILETSNADYDLIVAADVFVYIGSLDRTFRAISTHLNDGGSFIFSVEGIDGEQDYQQFSSGRHKHNAGYISRTLSIYGMDIIELVDCVVRKEFGQDAPGFTVIARK